MRRLLILVVTTTLLAANSTQAAYVLFFHVFGDWSVVCSKDEASDRRWCTLSAPPPAMESAGSRSLVKIGGGTGGEFTVALRLVGTIAPDQPAFLRIDGNIPHRTQPDRVGEALWSGAEAMRIVDEMKRGKAMVLRSFAAWTGAPRDEVISLDGFSEAFSTYQEKHATYGVESQ